MGIGLALTGIMAYYVSTNEAIIRLVFGNTFIFFGLFIAELALVFAISGMVQRMSSGTATALFVLYSALNGVTLSCIFLVYARGWIV
jgi:FtsH-binding integral membrane protein